MKCGQALEDGICHCPGRECTELELYKRLLYAGHDCDLWYPEALKKTISDLDTFFLAAFTIELACKVAARGLILHQHAYLREASNWLDFVVVMSGLATEIADKLNVDNLQSVDVFSVLRLVRVFRPLRSALQVLASCCLLVLKLLVQKCLVVSLECVEWASLKSAVRLKVFVPKVPCCLLRLRID